jgi:hypothetical protein
VRKTRAEVHFVVPPASEIGRSASFFCNGRPICAQGHLLAAFGYMSVFEAYGTAHPVVRHVLANNVSLVCGNDTARSPEARRQSLINWLRENFPECEVAE